MLILFSFQSAQTQYRVGDIVDNFIINDIDGDTIKFYDFKGRIIILYFFRTM